MNLPLYSPTAPGAVTKPGYGWYADDVHSQTSPKSPAESGSPTDLGCSVSMSSSWPTDSTPAAADSHSLSEGSRAPAQRAKASASKRLTWQTGSFGSTGRGPARVKISQPSSPIDQ